MTRRSWDNQSRLLVSCLASQVRQMHLQNATLIFVNTVLQHPLTRSLGTWPQTAKGPKK